MSERKVAIRIGTEGKAQVKSDFAEIRKDGAGAMQDIAAAARATGDAGDAQAKRLATSFDRATQDLEAAARRQAAAAAKIASITPKSAVQMQIEASSGTTARGGVVEQDLANRSLGQYEGSARASAAAFREFFAEQEASERAAQKLRAAIDPLFAAEQHFARALEEVAAAEKAGVLSTDLLADARRRAQAAYDDTRRSIADANSATKLGDNADAQARAYYAASAAEADKAQAAALRLKASIDPLWAAEQKLEQELREVALAEKAGILSADQLAQAQARARRQFDETTDAIKRQTGAGGGLSRMQKQTLVYTASDIVASAGSGASPAQIALQQGPQVLQAFAAEEGGLAKLRSMVGPTTVGVTALTAAIVLGAKAALDYETAYGKVAAVAQGVGAVSGQSADGLMRAAEQGASAANISIAAARDIELAYVQTGKIGEAMLPGLIGITKDFAAAMGQDLPAAAQTLASAFADPAKGAEELNAKLGFLDQKTADYVQTLVEQGRMSDAQIAMFQALGVAIDGAAEHVTGLSRAWSTVKSAASDAWEAMGRTIDRAITGGTMLDRLATLRNQRAIANSAAFYLGDTKALDAEIAQLERQLQAERGRTAQREANVRAQATASVVNRISGADALGQLKTDLAKVNATSGIHGRPAG